MQKTKNSQHSVMCKEAELSEILTLPNTD